MVCIAQNLLSGPGIPKSLDFKLFSITTVPRSVFQTLLVPKPPALGVAIQLTSDGLLDAVAFSTEIIILIITADSDSTSPAGRSTVKALKKILRSKKIPLAGFSIPKLALHIKKGLGIHVSGFDLSTLGPVSVNGPYSPGQCVKKATDAAANTDTYSIDSLWFSSADAQGHKYGNLAMRAWLSAMVARQWRTHLSSVSKVDTNLLRDTHFRLLHQMLVEIECMDAVKPSMVENDFSSVGLNKMGDVVIHNTRYKTRVRKGEQTRVVMIDAHGRQVYGRTIGIEGKRTTLSIKNLPVKNIRHIRVQGREKATAAENARDKLVLQILQGKVVLDNYLFTRLLWFPGPTVAKVPRKRRAAPTARTERLNRSQATVVDAMTLSNDNLVIVHGPPGTGKTSTISAAVKKWFQSNTCVWIVAQSNVGVKNIAESLSRHRVSFKLIVSKEFYVEWHEHVYKEVVDNIIRSDKFPADAKNMAGLLMDTRVILCTLSMLSNPVLQQRGIFRLVPMERLVVDEASQIGIFDFMHLFVQFNKLRKVCFFGDPKQLPPYGQDAAPTLQSIFDLKHLQAQAYFLDTQYRMPVPLGAFISTAVYSGKLKSEHTVKSSTCVVFVDVSLGKEVKAGNSWKNDREVQSVIHLVKYYYRNTDFCVITPYDAQRAALQKALEGENLPSDSVFNVDSFQGNEAKYVIVSVVRTSSPGFLKSQNRVNVMLTRCKAGMIIVTNRSFTEKTAVGKTLLGKLCRHWEITAGKSVAWRNWKDVAEERANLPGVLGRRAAPQPAVPTVPVKANLSAPKPSKGKSQSTSLSSKDMGATKVTKKGKGKNAAASTSTPFS